MFIMLTERTYYYKLELLWKKLRFEQNVIFLEIFKHYISFAHLFRWALNFVSWQLMFAIIQHK